MCSPSPREVALGLPASTLIAATVGVVASVSRQHAGVVPIACIALTVVTCCYQSICAVGVDAQWHLLRKAAFVSAYVAVLTLGFLGVIEAMGHDTDHEAMTCIIIYIVSLTCGTCVPHCPVSESESRDEEALIELELSHAL